MLQSANLHNKEEIDQVYKEVHSLRKRIAKLESESRSKTKNSLLEIEKELKTSTNMRYSN